MRISWLSSLLWWHNLGRSHQVMNLMPHHAVFMHPTAFLKSQRKLSNLKSFGSQIGVLKIV
jgi:hypothetical protein